MFIIWAWLSMWQGHLSAAVDRWGPSLPKKMRFCAQEEMVPPVASVFVKKEVNHALVVYWDLGQGMVSNTV